MFKVEHIDQQDENKKSYCFYLNLYNQKFFFKDSIKGSKLFKQAEDSGWQLDLKHQIKVQINDFKKQEEYGILDHFTKYT